jgi:diadenosine tetraphosphate (Ap4A) HIT family hydrolase
VGPLGVGTLIVKPLRHCVHVWDLTAEETLELGPLLALVAGAIRPREAVETFAARIRERLGVGDGD